MRYAIYYLPEETSALWQFGSAVIGYDCVTMQTVEHPDLGMAYDLRDLTDEPRTYGFHATLKAPFRLAQGVTEAELVKAVQSLAAQESALDIGDLNVRAIGSFVALTPRPNDALRDFAARCVQAFEPFRAPMAPDERAKRLRVPLTARQIELMDAWGYPYVFDAFRFHMTLTSSLTPAALSQAHEALVASYAKIAAASSLTSICICAQPQGERFRLLRRFALKPTHS
jgi:putative phosphonate metabolism protein